MPLKKPPKGASVKTKRKIQSKNIKELVDNWKDDGKIGNSKPKSKTAAIKQAVAISYRINEPKKKKKKKK